MGVRKSETRIPQDFSASDLGQAVVAADGRCALVSFIVTPLAIHRDNTYVVFVTDSSLAAQTQNFEWTFTQDEETPEVQTTTMGEIIFQPSVIGRLSVRVRLLGAGDAEQGTLVLVQDITALNPTVEELISNATNDSGPGLGNTEVAREMANDHNPYYKAITLQTPEPGDGFSQFVFSAVYDGALARTPVQRKTLLDQMAAAINEGQGDFASLAAPGLGVSAVRLALLAMVMPLSGAAKWISWRELPESANERAYADEVLRNDLAALEENKRIDLFNLVRFPKTNIRMCARIIEVLRDRYFGGTNFSDVLTGMSGTRAQWISRHYTEGPILHT